MILTVDSKHGALSYPCDTFENWQDNVRAIELALEALRKVDRYGVTRGGEQYRGFLALDAAPGLTVYEAWRLLKLAGGFAVEETPPLRLVRDAKRRTHPDSGGNAKTFQRVAEAEQFLREVREI